MISYQLQQNVAIFVPLSKYNHLFISLSSSPMARYLSAAMFTILLHLTLFILYQLLYFPTHSHPKLPIPWALPTPSNRHHDHHQPSTTTASSTSTQSHPDPIPKLTLFQQRFGRFGLNEEETFDLINTYLPNQKAITNKEDNINTANVEIKMDQTNQDPLHFSNDNNFGGLSMSLAVIIIWIIMSFSLMFAVFRWNKLQQHVEAESMDNIEEEEVTAAQPNSIMINQLTQESSIEEELDEWKALSSILQVNSMTIEHCIPHNGMCPSIRLPFCPLRKSIACNSS